MDRDRGRLSMNVMGERAFAFLVPGVVGLATMLLLGPTIFTDTARDWLTYRDAAQRLIAGDPLYTSGGHLLYIYPPALASIWAIGMTPSLLPAAKAIALVALTAIIGWPLGVAAVVLLLTTPSLQADLLLGNVMSFYAVSLT